MRLLKKTLNLKLNKNGYKRTFEWSLLMATVVVVSYFNVCDLRYVPTPILMCECLLSINF